MRVDMVHWNKNEAKPVCQNKYGLVQYATQTNMSNDRQLANAFVKHNRFTNFADGQKRANVTYHNKYAKKNKNDPPMFTATSDVQDYFRLSEYPLRSHPCAKLINESTIRYLEKWQLQCQVAAQKAKLVAVLRKLDATFKGITTYVSICNQEASSNVVQRPRTALGLTRGNTLFTYANVYNADLPTQGQHEWAQLPPPPPPKKAPRQKHVLNQKHLNSRNPFPSGANDATAHSEYESRYTMDAVYDGAKRRDFELAATRRAQCMKRPTTAYSRRFGQIKAPLPADYVFTQRPQTAKI